MEVFTPLNKVTATVIRERIAFMEDAMEQTSLWPRTQAVNYVNLPPKEPNGPSGMGGYKKRAGEWLKQLRESEFQEGIREAKSEATYNNTVIATL